MRQRYAVYLMCVFYGAQPGRRARTHRARLSLSDQLVILMKNKQKKYTANRKLP